MNLEAFLLDVLTPILDTPDALRIEVKENGRTMDLFIHADPKDRGRIIGKSGRMISSLRTLCQAAGEKSGLRVNVEIFEEENERRAHRPDRPDRAERPRPVN
ncbi:MAG: KH domain-containing protein [Holophaga sp.]|nr:KH domain-containing protein [Holophaga sp.]